MKTILQWCVWATLLAGSPFWTAADVTVSFHFDTFTGLDFTDNTGYGLQGRIVSSALERPARIAGVSGSENDRAVAFTGKGALAGDDSNTFSFDILPPFTIEVWARTTRAAQSNTAFVSYGFPDNPTQASGGYRLGLQEGRLVFSLYGVVDVLSGVEFPPDGQWHHAAAAYDFDRGVVHFFLDGKEKQSVEAAGDVKLPGRLEVSFGEVSPGFLPYIGDLDRVRISEGILSMADMDSDPATVKPVASTTLIYFSFDEASGNYRSQGSRPALAAVPVIDLLAQGVEYQQIPKTAEIVSDSPSGKPGDTAILFTGQEFALVEDPGGILEFPEDWTLEAWIKPQYVPDRTNAMVLYAYGAPGGGHSLQLAYSADDPTQLNVRGTAVGVLDIPAPNTFVVYDQWQHVAVAHKNGESMTFFLNGQLSEVIEYTQGMRPRTNEFLYIGTWPNALAFAYVGTLDRIRFSDRALTEAELDSDPSTFTGIETWDLY
ncbi:MAG TPA: LamG domain-containing protein [bacterium]|nr:LamG domain-containing protein [bacterium]HXK94551.1 LamG domain-containing protein [bacterium]